VIVNKIDLLPYVDFRLDDFKRAVRKLKPRVPILTISLRTGEGVDQWLDWLNRALVARGKKQKRGS
jgi:hydrogenase nickel incorporation protein HypB